MATIWPSIISMGCKSNSHAGIRRSGRTLLWLLFGVMLGTRLASACPFCTALSPTLCQQRERAPVTALAELETPAAGGPATVKLHQVLAGRELIGTQSEFTIPLDLAAERGTLLLLFAQGSTTDDLDWHAVPVNEASYGYFARAPGGNVPADVRLEYFAGYLEHPDRLIAEDAYLEFGHAPFDQVAEVVPQLSMAKVRSWLIDPRVPGGRKGFYGLVLGLASEPAERQANASFLRELILKPEDDFRAGFDGVLGGYLMLAPADGLALIESRYLANPKAAVGDVRHAQTALRFYHEYGRDLSTTQLALAVRQLLARPEFAEAAITDLARWQDWNALPEVAALFQKDGFEQPGVRRAVVGYLLACPEPSASAALVELRARDAAGVAAAEQILSTTGSVPQSR
jgi:hypothetical protein